MLCCLLFSELGWNARLSSRCQGLGLSVAGGHGKMSDLPGSGAGKGFLVSLVVSPGRPTASGSRPESRLVCWSCLRFLQAEQVQLEQGLTLLHVLQVCPGLWWLEKLNQCQHPSWILWASVHIPPSAEHTGTGCQMNFLMKTHIQEETSETKVHQSLTACLLLSNFTSGLFFSSAIKVFGLVLYRMSVCLFS